MILLYFFQNILSSLLCYSWLITERKKKTADIFKENNHLYLDKVKSKVKSLSCVRLFVTPWTVAYQAPLSMGFSRQ